MTSSRDALPPELLRGMDAYWRAANYLSVGQIYLQENPLLGIPLERAHIKTRLLGHWGTTPRLNFLYVHLKRAIRAHDLDMMLVVGPGHGGPGIVANTYLEGTYTERYPAIELNGSGLRRVFRQFSWPGGIPSHVAPETPGSIHEGGELGYSLAHAYGAAFDNPDLIVACVVGDGEAETGALATSWHSNKCLNPARDGAVLPILHLNGFKIANPTVLARIGHDELAALLRGYGYEPHFVEGSDPELLHQKLAETLDTIVARIRRIQSAARSQGTPRRAERPLWPMIVFRTPKGWTGPKFVDGKPVEGTWRAHQVWRQDHKRLSHQDPGFIDHVADKKPAVVRVYLPPDANTLLVVADHCLRSRHRINVIVAGKQVEWQWLDVDAAVQHCAAGAGIWAWASDIEGVPDVVMACAGDVPTLETLAAVTLLREYVPDIRVRVVNVVDLVSLQPPAEHPHGMNDQAFDALFTQETPVIFAFHGYAAMIHKLTYRRHNHANIHVRGYKEEGTTTTPFDMVVLNDLDRYRLALDAIKRIPRFADRVEDETVRYWTTMARHKAHIGEFGDDLPEVNGWRWQGRGGAADVTQVVPA